MKTRLDGVSLQDTHDLIASSLHAHTYSKICLFLIEFLVPVLFFMQSSHAYTRAFEPMLDNAAGTKRDGQMHKAACVQEELVASAGPVGSCSLLPHV